MKKIVLLGLAAVLLASVSGCVCDGTEKDFREVDRKFANSAWTAATVVPIFGWFVMPFILIDKDAAYQKVLLNKPVDSTYEAIRWSNRFNYVYSPDEK